MSITLQRYLTQKHKVLRTVHLAYIFTMQVLRRLGGEAKPPPQAPPQTPLMATICPRPLQVDNTFVFICRVAMLFRHVD